MILRSTFYDYYDGDFGQTGPVFRRVGGNSGPPKREQFRLLEAAGFRTPPHGLVGDVYYSWWEAEREWVRAVVAYEDESAHCGEGKVFVSEREIKVTPSMGGNRPDELRRNHLVGLYCSAFVGPRYRPTSATSWRRLQIGPHVFWVEYRSATSWMSNVDGECEVIGVEMDAGFHPHIRRPLFAIDFVLGREMYAVDLNYAPGVRWSGVENHLPGPAAVAAIQAWQDAFGGIDEL